MTPDAQARALKPCPFCGAGETIIHENHHSGITMEQTNREPISVEVKHWCEKIGGEVRNLTVKVGRDRQSAINAWNTRAARPTWTDERPTEPGWYWWKSSYADVQVVEITESGVAFQVFSKTAILVTNLSGQWAKIEMPQEEP